MTAVVSQSNTSTRSHAQDFSLAAPKEVVARIQHPEHLPYRKKKTTTTAITTDEEITQAGKRLGSKIEADSTDRNLTLQAGQRQRDERFYSK